MCIALQLYDQKCYKLCIVSFFMPIALAVILHSSCGLLSCFSLHYVLASSFILRQEFLLLPPQSSFRRRRVKQARSF